jgi:biopolymer transport protein ExbD
MVTAKIIVSQAMPLDLPKAASGKEVQMVFSVELRANGDLVVDGKKLPTTDALLPLAKEAQAKTPELRAVIRAESTVQHGRVMQSLDVLKRAGVTKIAFGVTPVADTEGGPAPTPAPATP